MLMLSKISDLIYFVTITFLVSLAHANVAAEDKADVNIRCSVAINDYEWTRIKSAKVHVKIENFAKESESFMVIPSFILEESRSETGKEAYWGPINLRDGSVRKKESKPDTLTLKEGESRTLDIDVSKLNWERSISALWPFQSLFSIVPPGQYKFYFELEIVDGRNSKRVRSREAMVTIK